MGSLIRTTTIVPLGTKHAAPMELNETDVIIGYDIRLRWSHLPDLTTLLFSLSVAEGSTKWLFIS
ncbi:hypothetical protein [Roseivirga pacifica]|uniref:hypothetical protein n=1 Tax=Roseivirga pacifica TaxID=1267423 RepID=UPI003BA9FC8D